MTKFIVVFHNFANAPKNGSHTRYESVDWVQCGSGRDVKHFLLTVQCPKNVRRFLVSRAQKNAKKTVICL
jgi:hypothetical protein